MTGKEAEILAMGGTWVRRESWVEVTRASFTFVAHRETLPAEHTDSWIKDPDFDIPPELFLITLDGIGCGCPSCVGDAINSTTLFSFTDTDLAAGDWYIVEINHDE